MSAQASCSPVKPGNRHVPREPWIMDPAEARPGVERLVALSGSVEAAAEIAGVTTATIYRWRAGWTGGGGLGRVPAGRVRLILINAKKASVALTHADLGAVRQSEEIQS